MKKIPATFIIFIIALSASLLTGVYSIVGLLNERNTPPLPPINVDIPSNPNTPEKPDCNQQTTLDESVACEIKYYSDQGNRVIHFTPKQQANIYGSKNQNNEILWNHLSKTSQNFFIAGEQSYVVVITKKSVANSRDMLLGVLGRSQGALHKNMRYDFISDLSENKKDSLYIFPVNRINVIGYGPDSDNIDLLKYRNNQNLVPISFAVGENGNYVTDIYIINSLAKK